MKTVLIAALFLGVTAAATAQEHDFIEGPFSTPQEVTATCLGCHEEAGTDIMKSRHWNWLGDAFDDGEHGVIRIGKQNFINNFCIGVTSNWPRCTSCHISYGWKDNSFDHSDPGNIDCLVCHDQTGTYKKSPAGAGMPAEGVDLVTVAQSVGAPSRRNCGVCHFDGGGGSGVKHGDLDDSMYDPPRELDVHMGGLGFECTQCHTTEKHQVMGAGHGSLAQDMHHIACTDCHDAEVHEKSVLNKHTATVACETCHIPAFARQEPTKTWWDWSKAGEDRPEEKDALGMDTYAKMKGEFTWEKNVVPTYKWTRGKADYYMQGDPVKAGEVVKLNRIVGSIDDAESRIAPFKVMRGKQPFDTKNNYLIVPHLFGKDGYWKTFDWDSASRIGMEAAGLAYSGSYDFIETEMSWPINHMVAPADQALGCTSCHGKKGDHRLDWKSLGYKGDPMTKGGRVKQGLVKAQKK